MSGGAGVVRAVLAAEWTKMRTVRSTYWTLLTAIAVSVGLGALISRSLRSGFEKMSAERQADFDPLFVSSLPLTLGQLALVVFGVLLVGGEYSNGTIRTSLLAVPRRGLLFTGKVLAATAPVLAVSAVTALATFWTAQKGLGELGTSLGADGAWQAVLGGCLNMTLLTLFAMGLAAVLRSPTLVLALLLPLFLLNSQGLGNVPALMPFMQYLPDQAGLVIMHIAGPQDEARWARDYGAWTGLGILALWTALSLVAGHLTLRRRDA